MTGKSQWKAAKFSEGQGCSSKFSVPGTVLGHFPGNLTRSQGGSEAFRMLVLPEGHLPIIAAGGQEPWLLGVPGHTVDVLGVGLVLVGCQREGGLLRI